jgi:hypothetical protein
LAADVGFQIHSPKKLKNNNSTDRLPKKLLFFFKSFFSWDFFFSGISVNYIALHFVGKNGYWRVHHDNNTFWGCYYIAYVKFRTNKKIGNISVE